MKKSGFITLFICLVFIFQGHNAKADQNPVGKIPVPGMVTMVDLGSDRCIPCRMMAPILEEVTVDYKGKAAIIFLDVWKDNSLAKTFGIRVIPTQIFYDNQGREVARHEGFLPKEDIVAMLHKLGVNK